MPWNALGRGYSAILGQHYRSTESIISSALENYFHLRAETFGPYLEKHFRKCARQQGDLRLGGIARQICAHIRISNSSGHQSHASKLTVTR